MQAIAWLGYPPNSHTYRYWRDKGGEDVDVRFMQDVTNMRALRAKMEHLGEGLR